MTTTVERPTSTSEKATQPEGSKPTKRQNAERGFKASQQLHENMQKVLVDLIELHIQGKQAHWNVVGANFRDLHLQLDEIIDSAREFSDDLAERMRALHATPDGRSDTVAENTTLPEYPQGEVDTAETVDLIVGALYGVSSTARRIHDDVDAEDPTTADLLHTIIERIEQLAWMVDAENRTAGKSVPENIAP